MTEQQKDALAAFKRDTAEHTMSVLMDNGLYRHLRFRKNGSSVYGFDILTYPGRLVISGDMGDAVFARLPDMFDFFRASPGEHDADKLYINPGYWHEKLTVGRGESEEVDEVRLKNSVYAYLDEFTREFRDSHGDDDVSEALDELREAVDGIFTESDVGLAVVSFDASDVDKRLSRFNLADRLDYHIPKDYTFHAYWRLYAIAHAVREYDKLKGVSHD